MSFQPLELGWFGGGEVKTLAKVEWLGGMPLLGGRCLLLGYYLNELLLKMLPREDAHAALFDAYAAALQALAAAMPCNAGKALEFGRDNAVSPPRGASTASTSPAASASGSISLRQL